MMLFLLLSSEQSLHRSQIRESGEGLFHLLQRQREEESLRLLREAPLLGEEEELVLVLPLFLLQRGLSPFETEHQQE